MGRSKACKIPGTGQHLECSGRCQGDTVAWFCSWGLFCQAHRTRSGCIRAGGSTLCPRDVLESEDGLGFMSSPQGMVQLWVLLCEQRALCLSHSLVCCRVFPQLAIPPCFLCKILHKPSFSFCLSSPGEERQLGIELMGMAAQHPGIPTTNPGMGPGTQHVFLHVFKELLNHPSQPMGNLCDASFTHLASTFANWPPESSTLDV